MMLDSRRTTAPLTRDRSWRSPPRSAAAGSLMIHEGGYSSFYVPVLRARRDRADVAATAATPTSRPSRPTATRSRASSSSTSTTAVERAAANVELVPTLGLMRRSGAPMAEFTVRGARSEDAAAMARLVRRGRRGARRHRHRSARRRRRAHRPGSSDSAGATVVAIVEDVIIGDDHGRRPAASPQAVSGRSWTRPGDGRGVGSELPQAGDRVVARRRACTSSALEVFPANAAAIALYRKFGFVEEGRRVKQYRRASGELWDAHPHARAFCRARGPRPRCRMTDAASGGLATERGDAGDELAAERHRPASTSSVNCEGLMQKVVKPAAALRRYRLQRLAEIGHGGPGRRTLPWSRRPTPGSPHVPACRAPSRHAAVPSPSGAGRPSGLNPSP